MPIFSRILFKQFDARFRDKYITLIELMVMHRRIFMLGDNLHDLMCRGSQDYKESLQNVDQYNMSKILAFKCSIPSRSGDRKLNKVEMNVVRAVFADIEMYNFIDITLRKFKMGKLRQEVQSMELAKSTDLKSDRVDTLEEEADDGDMDLMPKLIYGPDGGPLYRNQADIMNNLFIN